MLPYVSVYYIYYITYKHFFFPFINLEFMEIKLIKNPKTHPLKAKVTVFYEALYISTLCVNLYHMF